MKICQLLLLAAGLLIFSPFVLADEMGTGNPDNSSSQPPSSSDSEEGADATTGSDACSLWETFIAWFEQE